jgi:hypothetical protein
MLPGLRHYLPGSGGAFVFRLNKSDPAVHLKSVLASLGHTNPVVVIRLLHEEDRDVSTWDGGKLTGTGVKRHRANTFEGTNVRTYRTGKGGVDSADGNAGFITTILDWIVPLVCFCGHQVVISGTTNSEDL